MHFLGIDFFIEWETANRVSEQFNLRQSTQSPSVTFQLVSAYYVVAVEMFHIFYSTFVRSSNTGFKHRARKILILLWVQWDYGKSTDCPFAEPELWLCNRARNSCFNGFTVSSMDRVLHFHIDAIEQLKSINKITKMTPHYNGKKIACSIGVHYLLLCGFCVATK